MSRGALARLLSFQHYNHFIERIGHLNEDKYYQNILNEYIEKWGNTITLPENLEEEIYRNIDIDVVKDTGEVLEEEPQSVISKITINWDNVYAGISFKKLHKDDSEKLILQAKIIIVLLEKCWDLIDIFFPVTVYGLPNHQFICILMNLLVDDKFKVTTGDIKNDYWIKKGEDSLVRPFIYKTNDIYRVLKDMEIAYLRQKLQEKVPDLNIEDEMFKDGYFLKKQAMGKILNKDLLYLHIEPMITKSHLTKGYNGKNVFDEIKTSLEVTSPEVFPELVKDCSKLLTILIRSETFIDLWLNKKMKYKAISETTGLKYSQVRDDITELAEAIGVKNVEISGYEDADN